MYFLSVGQGMWPYKVITTDRRLKKGVVADSFATLFQKCKYITERFGEQRWTRSNPRTPLLATGFQFVS